MDRQDDPTLAGSLVLYRRIPPSGGRVEWDDKGIPIPTSGNFRDRNDELSATIAAETTVEKMLEEHESFGLVYFTAQQVRDLGCPGLLLCRDEPPLGHVLICGKISLGKAKLFKQFVRWVDGKWPARLPDP